MSKQAKTVSVSISIFPLQKGSLKIQHQMPSGFVWHWNSWIFIP